MKKKIVSRVFKLTEFGNKILRKKTRKVDLRKIKDRNFKNLLNRMFLTMKANDGVGLAANQIGLDMSLAVIQIPKNNKRPGVKPSSKIVIINPKILEYSKPQNGMYEGCLSLKNVRGYRMRSSSIVVEYFNELGDYKIEKLKGFYARVFQHEIDHLNGRAYFDEVDPVKLISAYEFKKMVNKNKK